MDKFPGNIGSTHSYLLFPLRMNILKVAQVFNPYNFGIISLTGEPGLHIL